MPSSESVAEKLYIKPGMEIGIFNAPDNLTELLGELPENVNIKRELSGVKLDMVIGFIKDRRMLESYLGSLKDALEENGALWIFYKEKSSPEHTDLDRDYIHDQVSKNNMKGVGMISINNNWAAMRCKEI